ncbi:MAG: M67 family metallopeptidase [Solirubrobacterales bacterium]|nr:M67 family metallopeptidase [Solirubrobacterales bacterium]
MRIAPGLLDEVVAHALRDAPDECCGVVAARDGAATSVHATENLAHSPYRFEVEGLVLLRLLEDLERAGEGVQAIYHSHPHSPAYPSQTDVNFAGGWPGVAWLIVSLATGEPDVRSFSITQGRIAEEALEVT